MSDEKPFGVYTGQSNHWFNGEAALRILRTPDGVTHHIRVESFSKKWLRYVLRHDQKLYLLVSASADVVDDVPITCVICLAKGPETPEAFDIVEDD